MTLVLCATGVTALDGGIANSNRNAVLALAALGAELGVPVEVLTLLETRGNATGARAFGGDKVGFATATLTALLRARLVLFDHAHLAGPIVALPRRLRAKVVIFGHGSEIGRNIRPLSRRALLAANLVLTNSEHTLRAMRLALGRDDVGLACPLGLPPHVPLTPEPPGENEGAAARAGLALEAADGVPRLVGPRMMLIVGRLDSGEREKGHRELIAALPALLERSPEAQLAIVGGGSDEAELRRIAAVSSAAPAILFTGRIPDDLLQRLYRSAYAYVMPSRQEGFGLVYLEAMSQALPCVACRGDGGGEVVVDAETGFLVNQPIELAAVVETLTRLLADPGAARRMGLAGWRRLKALFTAEAHQARLTERLRPLASAPLGGDRRSAMVGSRR